jgi:hypothetical protein
LILKGALLVVLDLQSLKRLPEKEKREQAPALQNAVIYKIQCSTDYENVKRVFAEGK